MSNKAKLWIRRVLARARGFIAQTRLQNRYATNVNFGLIANQLILEYGALRYDFELLSARHNHPDSIVELATAQRKIEAKLDQIDVEVSSDVDQINLWATLAVVDYREAKRALYSLPSPARGTLSYEAALRREEQLEESLNNFWLANGLDLAEMRRIKQRIDSYILQAFDG